MPNWVYTNMTLAVGSLNMKPHQKRFLSFMMQEPEKALTIPEILIPEPLMLKEVEGALTIEINIQQDDTWKEANMEAYLAPFWYDWRNANWGCKWAPSDQQVNITDTETYISFATPWSALDLRVINLFAHYFPNFELEWEEEQGFGLRTRYENGLRVEEYEWDIPSWNYVEDLYSDEENFPEVPDTLKETFIRLDYEGKDNSPLGFYRCKNGYFTPENTLNCEYLTENKQEFINILKVAISLLNDEQERN